MIFRTTCFWEISSFHSAVNDYKPNTEFQSVMNFIQGYFLITTAVIVCIDKTRISAIAILTLMQEIGSSLSP